MNVLYWIYGDRESKQFVENRVKKIRSLLEKELWRYCDGNQNIGDIASIGSSLSKLAYSLLWLEGPE